MHESVISRFDREIKRLEAHKGQPWADAMAKAIRETKAALLKAEADANVAMVKNLEMGRGNHAPRIPHNDPYR
jgi:signal recognition particle GTPase